MRYNSVIPWRRHMFVDCGGNDGCSIRRFIKDFDPHGRFEMVTFEPNDLYATCYSDLPRHCLIEAAVHDRDGFQNFFLDRDDGDGSSLFGNKLTRENGGFGTLDTANPARARRRALRSRSSRAPRPSRPRTSSRTRRSRRGRACPAISFRIRRRSGPARSTPANPMRNGG